jgi:hypothetical protein
VVRPEVTGRRIGSPGKARKTDTAEVIAAADDDASVDAADDDAPSALSLVKSPPISQSPPPRHHIDKRAARLLTENDGDEDDLLSTAVTAEWLGVSPQWLELGRMRNYGPVFTRLSSRVIRYKRSDILKWLRTRTHQSTAEYG